MEKFEHFLMHCLYFVLIVCSKSLPFFRFIINNMHNSFYASEIVFVNSV